MPSFNGLLTPPHTDVRQGELFTFFNAESPAAGVNSVVMCRGLIPGGQNYQTFSWTSASAPSAGFTIFGSNTPPTTAGPQNGVTIATETTQTGALVDNSTYAFYWVQKITDTTGEPLTVNCQR